jgi:hypothetical protein
MTDRVSASVGGTSRSERAESSSLDEHPIPMELRMVSTARAMHRIEFPIGVNRRIAASIYDPVCHWRVG